ncbi:MAG: hypothetical protein ACRC7R_09310, partial [Sarcina sp.]
VAGKVAITYQISFTTTPTSNPVVLNPVLNYSYVDSSNATQNGSFTGTSSSLYVATIQKPTPTTNTVQDVYSNTLKGGVVITGNALMVVGSDNSKAREYMKQDGTLTTDWKQNGSEAYLDIPSGSTVVKAYLEWYSGVTVNSADMPESYDPVIFKTPTSNYTVFGTNEVRFNPASTANNSSKWVDVTSYVTGVGTYAINRVASSQNASSDHGAITGWSLVVVYSNSSLSNRFVNIKIGFNPATTSFTKTQRAVTFTGFTVPQTPGKTHLMMVASVASPGVKNGLSIYSDIANIANTGAQYQVGNTAPSTGADPGTMPVVPYDNVFGGFIMNTNTESTNYGKIETRGTLGNKNNSPYNIASQTSFTGNRTKHDILAFDISSKMNAGQNTLITTVEDINLSAEWV